MYELRVERGVKLLNKRFGKNWFRKIRTSRLKMSTGHYQGSSKDKSDSYHCGCILAQVDHYSNHSVMGNYSSARVWLGLQNGEDAVQYGFFIRDCNSPKQLEAKYKALTETWINKIRALKGGK